MSRDDDPLALRWIRDQAARGATIIGVCAGAKVVGKAGLLEGKRATTHWYYLQELRESHPALTYVANRRLVGDQGIATTTGITSSMPMMLTLIEAIAGPEKAETTARDLGLTVTTNWPSERLLPQIGSKPPAKALDDVVQAIGARYGTGTAEFVAVQLEYPW
jgi:transcriptional regulator GlxA family with amidase domain